jgi:NADPH-dependent 2,4-dienoyl-CoA reductase/sulfur reductase-like enzyme
VVLGGGFIGAEIAAALRLQQRPVTMIVPEQGIGPRVFPPDLAGFVADYYRRHGVTVHLGDSVERIGSQGARFLVRAKVAGTLVADAVVAGLGIVPNVDLARQAGLALDDGIVVDHHLRTSHPDVYAAGDVARFVNPALGKRLRVEHEDNANRMGRVAGRNMAGADERYDHLPFFYSDLFDLGYEAVGEVDARHQTVADWKQEFREGVVNLSRSWQGDPSDRRASLWPVQIERAPRNIQHKRDGLAGPLERPALELPRNRFDHLAAVVRRRRALHRHSEQWIGEVGVHQVQIDP